MFKIKFDEISKKRIEQKLNVEESASPLIVLCANKEDIEEDKINIVFTMDQLDALNDNIFFSSQLKKTTLQGKTYRGTVSLDIKDIDLIQAYGNEVYTKINGTRVDFSLKLYQVLEKLESLGFIRISKSEIVNIASVEAIASGFNGKLILTLRNKQEVEVNRSFKKEFLKSIES